MSANCSTNLPLVTFAVIAYNQEEYIREAIEGAFSQSYEHLEIILSDDNSIDRTFEIMREMAANYKGPHAVNVSRQMRNLGLAFHVNTVLEKAQGHYVVLAAGDDVSEPHRTNTSVNELQNKAALLFHSDVSPIGGALKFSISELCLFRETQLNEIATAEKLYLGATGVIARSLFDKYGPLPYSDIYEDQIFGFRARLEGRVCYSEEKLVKYRVNIGMSGGSSPLKRGISEYRKRRLFEIKRSLHTSQARLSDLINSPCAGHSDIVRVLNRAIKNYEIQHSVVKNPFRKIFGKQIILRARELIAMARVVAKFKYDIKK